MNTSRLPNQKQPLSFSLASLRSAAAVVAALLAASPSARAQSTWDGNTLPTPGDGLLWTDPLNWSGDALPGGADVIFANALAGVGTIFLNGDQSANSLTFTESDTLGAYGTNNFLNNLSGAVTVTSGDFATINASYGGTNGIILSGGGTLFLNNPFPTYTGNITVDGVGTTLLHRQEGPGVQYNGINSAQEFGRFDQLTLGASTTVRTITLTNGGEYKIINTGNNPELNFKNIVIGSGGGTLNLGAGYILQNLDDLGQITATTEAFTKAGKGRLVITGTMAVNNPLAGIVNINGGMLSLDNITSQTVGANTYNRFTGIAALGTTLNINSGGTLMINSGTQSFSDVPIINANNGSIIAVNGQDHIFGYAVAAAASAASLNITGTSTLLTMIPPHSQRRGNRAVFT